LGDEKLEQDRLKDELEVRFGAFSSYGLDVITYFDVDPP